jgi:hypothetical protein
MGYLCQQVQGNSAWSCQPNRTARHPISPGKPRRNGLDQKLALRWFMMHA